MISEKLSPTEEDIKSILNLPADKPVVMLNQLKFLDRTPEGKSGKRLYMMYQKRVTPLLEKVGGRAVWLGEAKLPLVDDSGWDLTLLVEYPTPQAFVDLVTSPEYGEIAHLREEALEKATLIAHHALG